MWSDFMTFGDYISILSIIITIYIGFSQYRLDKNINKIMEIRRKDELSNKVKKFIIDHDSELNYIPLCFIASKYNNHHKFEREIYNDYNYLTDEEQCELLLQLKYNFTVIKNKNWLDEGIKKIEEFIEQNDFGVNIFNKSGIYLKLSTDYSSIKYDINREINEPLCSDYFNSNNITFRNDNCQYNKICTADYFFDYYFKVSLNHDVSILANSNVLPPINMVIEKKNLSNCNEEELCFWMMNITTYILTIMNDNIYDNNERCINYGDAVIETYEDKYLTVLMGIYNLFIP